MFFVRYPIDGTGGEVRLDVEMTSGVAVWVDGELWRRRVCPKAHMALCSAT